MNVLVVLKSGLSDNLTDGLTRWLYNVIRCMAKSVARIDVLSPSDTFTSVLSELQTFCCHCAIIKERSHGKKYVNLLRGWDSAALGAFRPEMSKTLARWTSETTYDLAMFCGHGAHCYLNDVRAAHRMIVPLDAPCGLAMRRLDGMSAALKSHANRLFLCFSQRLYNGANSVLVVSDADAALLRSAGVRVPILVLPMAVDTRYFQGEPSDLSPAPSILFTGVLDFPPNVDAALHLARDIFVGQNLQCGSMLCTIAGRRPTKEVQQLGALPGVRVIGDPFDLRPLFRESLIYAAPMRTGLGMKTKMLEALAMSKPVVAYPRALNGFRLPVPGVLCSETPAEFAGVVQRISTDPALCQRLGAAGRKYVERHHSPDQMVARLLEFAARPQSKAWSSAELCDGI